MTLILKQREYFKPPRAFGKVLRMSIHHHANNQVEDITMSLIGGATCSFESRFFMGQYYPTLKTFLAKI